MERWQMSGRRPVHQAISCVPKSKCWRPPIAVCTGSYPVTRTRSKSTSVTPFTSRTKRMIPGAKVNKCIPGGLHPLRSWRSGTWSNGNLPGKRCQLTDKVAGTLPIRLRSGRGLCGFRSGRHSSPQGAFRSAVSGLSGDVGSQGRGNHLLRR